MVSPFFIFGFYFYCCFYSWKVRCVGATSWRFSETVICGCRFCEGREVGDFLFVCRVCKEGGDRFVELVLVRQRVFIIYLMFVVVVLVKQVTHSRESHIVILTLVKLVSRERRAQLAGALETDFSQS